jgi:hypothetical protein
LVDCEKKFHKTNLSALKLFFNSTDLPSGMKLSPKVHLWIALFYAAGASALGYWADSQYRLSRAKGASTELARRVVIQAESLALAAREKGQEEPLKWSANILAQGPGANQYHISPFQFDPTVPVEAGGERVHFDPDRGLVSYAKLTEPMSSTGFHVEVPVQAELFLGAPNRITGDSLFVFFFFLTTLAVHALIRFVGFGEDAAVSSGMAELTREFAGEARSGLVRFATHVRDMVRESAAISTGAARSRDRVGEIRSRLHSQLKVLQEFRDTAKECLVNGQEAETVALNLVIESTHLGEKGKPIAAMAEQLHKYVQKLRHLGKHAEDAGQAVQVNLEPMGTDSDLAFHSFENLPTQAASLDTQIRMVTEWVVEHAKFVQGFQVRVAEEANAKPAEKATEAAPAKALREAPAQAPAPIAKAPAPVVAEPVAPSPQVVTSAPVAATPPPAAAAITAEAIEALKNASFPSQMGESYFVVEAQPEEKIKLPIKEGVELALPDYTPEAIVTDDMAALLAAEMAAEAMKAQGGGTPPGAEFAVELDPSVLGDSTKKAA